MWNDRNVRFVQLLLLLVVVAGHLGVTDSLAGAGIPTAGTGTVTGGGGTPPSTQSHVLSHKKVVVVGGTVVFLLGTMNPSGRLSTID